MPEFTIQFRPGHLAAPVAERMRGDLNQNAVVQRDLDRYYTALALGLSSVDLTPGEAMLIIDSHNGTWIDLNAAQMLPYQIEDSLQDGLAEKWEIDGPALVKKLSGYSLAQRLAILDGVERWWGDTYHVENGRARLVRVGLVKE